MSAFRQTPMGPTTPGGRYHAGHGMDQRAGDCGRAIRRTALRIFRQRYIDLNFQKGQHLVFNLHSRTARENGYLFIQVGKTRRPMTHDELDRDLADWDDDQVLLWRCTEKAGLSYMSRLRPGTYGERVRLAQRLRVRICAEIKFPITEGTAVQMVAYATGRKATVFFMALVYETRHAVERGAPMTAAGRKAKAIHAAGGQFALLTHGYAPPHDLDQYRPFITQFWGTNAKEYRK